MLLSSLTTPYQSAFGDHALRAIQCIIKTLFMPASMDKSLFFEFYHVLVNIYFQYLIYKVKSQIYKVAVIKYLP